jgi:pyrroline-5-carboxylate reductase
MQINHPNIAIIGAGNMGASLLGGLVAKDYPLNKITIADPSTEKLTPLQKQYKVQISTANLTIVKTASVIIFAIKPQIFAEVARELADTIQQQKPLIISIAAGITLSAMQQWLGKKIPIVRSMPNTPALIGCGASALLANPYVSEQQKQMTEMILQTVGITTWLDDEKLMDVITALSGSGPAYFFSIIEALQEAGEKLGLTPEVARLFTLQTAYGAARMAIEDKRTTQELRKAVTSPGGTTAAALQVLEKYNIVNIMTETVLAAKNRAEELANTFK